MFGFLKKDKKRMSYFEMTKIISDEEATRMIEKYVEKYKESLFLEMAEHERTYNTGSGYILCTQNREPNENEQKVLNAFINAKEGDWDLYEELKKETNSSRNLAIDFMYAKYAQDLVYMREKMYDKLSDE